MTVRLLKAVPGLVEDLSVDKVIKLIGGALFFVGYVYFRTQNPMPWQPNYDEQRSQAEPVVVEVVDSDVPWPLWDESLLPPFCENAGTATDQLLQCYNEDGSLAWDPSELPANCRMVPAADGNAEAFCR